MPSHMNKHEGYVHAVNAVLRSQQTNHPHTRDLANAALRATKRAIQSNSDEDHYDAHLLHSLAGNAQGDIEQRGRSQERPHHEAARKYHREASQWHLLQEGNLPKGRREAESNESKIARAQRE